MQKSGGEESPAGGGKRTGCAWWQNVCRRCLCKSEENEYRSPKGANMAGAIFGGRIVEVLRAGTGMLSQVSKSPDGASAGEPHLAAKCL